MKSGLRKLARVEVPVRSTARHQLSPGCREFTGDAFSAFVAHDVIERMLTIGRASAPDEWMGLLLGYVGRDDDGDYVVVRAMVHDHEALARPGFIESTHESEARTRLLARLLFPDLVSLGWAHGHVRCGAFFSPEDRKTQASWTAAYSVGIVVDPWDPKELAIFRGPESEELEAETPREGDSEPLRRTARPIHDHSPRRSSRFSRFFRVLRAAGLALLTLAALSALVALTVFVYRIHLRVRAIERGARTVWESCP